MSKTPPKNATDTGAPEVDTLEDEAFLTRWSRRKALSREGVELPEPVEEKADDKESSSDDSGDKNDGTQQDAEAPDATTALPPIESLDEHSDYGAFLASDVPVDLQRKALRKLFRSPKFNVRDGLDDYDLDFSSPEPLGDIVTAEMRRRLRAELERLAGLDDEESAVEHDDEQAASAEVAETDEQGQSADSEPDDDQPATA